MSFRGLLLSSLVFWFAPLAIICAPLQAQTGDDFVIPSSTRHFEIIDDGDKQKAEIVDNLPVDLYVYHPARHEKEIRIVTDRAEWVYQFAWGQEVDFAIEYGGRKYRQRLVPVEPHKWVGPDELIVPFRLGPNNNIIIKASINGAKPMDMLFDTGASISAINVWQRPASDTRRLVDISIGGVTIKDTPVVDIQYRDTLQASGLLGYNLFMGRQVTINYGRGELRVGKPVSSTPLGFKSLPIQWRGAWSIVKLNIDDGKTSRKIDVLLDTGSKWSLSLTNQDPLSNEIGLLRTEGWRVSRKADGARVHSKIFTLPAVSLAGFRIPNVQTDIETGERHSLLGVHILGNDFLKRFDLIIDYRHGVIHVKPNFKRDEPFNKIIFGTKSLLFFGAAIAAISAFTFLMQHYKIRSRSKTTHRIVQE